MRNDSSLFLNIYITHNDSWIERFMQTCAYEYALNESVTGMGWNDVFYLCSCNYKPERKWPNLVNEVHYGDTNCDNSMNW